MFNLKNLKVVKELKNIQPKLKWMMFSEVEDYKMNSRYFDLICGDRDNNVEATEEYLQKMVRESLIKEFSADIKDTASLIEKEEEPIIFKGSNKYHKKRYKISLLF